MFTDWLFLMSICRVRDGPAGLRTSIRYEPSGKVSRLTGGETPQIVVQQDEKALRSRLLASAGAPHQFGDFTHGRKFLRLPLDPAGSHSAPTPKCCAIPAQRVQTRE